VRFSHLFIAVSIAAIQTGFLWASDDQPSKSCETGKLAFQNVAPIKDLKAVLNKCRHAGDPSLEKLVLRTFKKHQTRYVFTVNTQTLETAVEPLSCFSKCVKTNWDEWLETPFGKAQKFATKSPFSVHNDGVTHATVKRDGYFLTIDLCPTKGAKALHQELIDRLANHIGPQSKSTVAVNFAITGRWIKQHPEDFAKLRELEKEKQLYIRWINHSYSHPFSGAKDIKKDFLLRPGVKLSTEILKTESLLLKDGAVPSLFFRFPGLVSDEELVLELKAFGLMPLGADAWLAIGQKPKTGGVILIHGNGNEVFGVEKFFHWMQSQKKEPSFLPIEKLF